MSATSTSPGQGLSLRGIGARFGGLVALDGVSLDVEPGRIVGVIGPNGAGKTTLFNVVCGFVRPTAGTMSWRGSPLRPRPHRLASLGIGRTLQAVGLFTGLSVLENVMTGGHHTIRSGFTSALFGLPWSDRDERRLRAEAMKLLEELDIAGYARMLPTPLPFAVQKRVALARALIARPALLMLDEPAAGLAAEEIDELATLITGLPSHADSPCAVMLVEHHMDLVMRVCDEIVVLDFGKVIAHGDPAAIRSSTAVTTAYLGTMAEEYDPDTVAVVGTAESTEDGEVAP
jgi:branched-chain amino acid transport system ATP-binding protein